jgi:hypothetical protein
MLCSSYRIPPCDIVSAGARVTLERDRTSSSTTPRSQWVCRPLSHEILIIARPARWGWEKILCDGAVFARRTTPLNLLPRVVLHTCSPRILLIGEPSCEQSSWLILPLFNDLFLPWLNDSDPKIQHYMIEDCSQRRDRVAALSHGFLHRRTAVPRKTGQHPP